MDFGQVVSIIHQIVLQLFLNLGCGRCVWDSYVWIVSLRDVATDSAAILGPAGMWIVVSHLLIF